MGLNQSKGNMYEFVTHTWNTVKGKCPHGCTYCYMHRWGKQKPPRFDESELKTDMGSGNFIFVGSSCDMFADEINPEWIIKTLKYCSQFDNRYLFQSKNPKAFLSSYGAFMPERIAICTTIESNIFYPEIMKQSPKPAERAMAMRSISPYVESFITIEPIMDFDMEKFFELLYLSHPLQINIGADTGRNNLPEPTKDKVLELIEQLKTFTKVVIKPNLNRIIK